MSDSGQYRRGDLATAGGAVLAAAGITRFAGPWLNERWPLVLAAIALAIGAAASVLRSSNALRGLVGALRLCAALLGYLCWRGTLREAWIAIALAVAYADGRSLRELTRPLVPPALALALALAYGAYRPDPRVADCAAVGAAAIWAWGLGARRNASGSSAQAPEARMARTRASTGSSAGGSS